MYCTRQTLKIIPYNYQEAMSVGESPSRFFLPGGRDTHPSKGAACTFSLSIFVADQECHFQRQGCHSALSVLCNSLLQLGRKGNGRLVRIKISDASLH